MINQIYFNFWYDIMGVSLNNGNINLLKKGLIPIIIQMSYGLFKL